MVRLRHRPKGGDRHRGHRAGHVDGGHLSVRQQVGQDPDVGTSSTALPRPIFRQRRPEVGPDQHHGTADLDRHRAGAAVDGRLPSTPTELGVRGPLGRSALLGGD